MFQKFIIDCPANIFEDLMKTIEFEPIIKGRQGANLVDNNHNDNNNLLPMVRTTTPYGKPCQRFQSIHRDIIEKIKIVSKIENLEFNNAMIELYDSCYRNMKFHSDQSLDLVENSYICIYSCYDDPADIRKLKIKEKKTKECSEILMEHNSIVIFSTATNKQYLHKIVLETNKSENKWLGITFRLSKTFIQFIDALPYFYPGGKLLRLANKDERKEFSKYKGMENSQVNYQYPEIDYTVSISDIIKIG
jgi:hypothetical protein